MSDEYSTAIHEAGHAVMGLKFGKEIEYVHIVPKENKLGECKFIDYKQQPRDDVEEGIRVQIELLILIAGTTSEAVIMGTNPIESQGKEDYKKADKILDAPKDGLAKVRSDNIHALAYKIFREPETKEQIKAVADALIKHKTLTGKQVEKIMQEIS